MKPGQESSFNEEDVAEADVVSEQIKAVDLELQQLKFEMQYEQAKQEKERKRRKKK
jgi:hypothetical protein